MYNTPPKILDRYYHISGYSNTSVCSCITQSIHHTHKDIAAGSAISVAAGTAPAARAVTAKLEALRAGPFHDAPPLSPSDIVAVSSRMAGPTSTKALVPMTVSVGTDPRSHGRETMVPPPVTVSVGTDPQPQGWEIVAPPLVMVSVGTAPQPQTVAAVEAEAATEDFVLSWTGVDEDSIIA